MSETEAQTTKKRTKKDDYIVQGSILAAAAVLTKIIGVVYRIPLTNILGDEGNGLSGKRLPGHFLPWRAGMVLQLREYKPSPWGDVLWCLH